MEGSTTLSTSDWTLDDADLGMIWFERPLVVGTRYTVQYQGGFDPLPEDIKGLLLRQSAIAFKRTKGQSWELESTDTDTKFWCQRIGKALEPVDTHRTDDLEQVPGDLGANAL